MNSEKAQAIIEIDEFNLDKECIRFPSDYLYYSNHQADLRRDLEEVKNQLEVVSADLSKKVRQDPSVYGLEKLTESAVSDIVTRDPKYKEAQKKLIDAKHELDLCGAVVGALDAKKKCLEMLVSLHGMGYFSNVKMNRQGKEAVEEMTKKAVRSKWRE